MSTINCPFFAESAQSFKGMARFYALYELFWPWSLFSPMGEFVECGDSSPHGSENGDESPHSTLGGLFDDQGHYFLNN